MPLKFRKDPDTDINVLAERLNNGTLKLDSISNDCYCIVIKYPHKTIPPDTMHTYVEYLTEFFNKKVFAIPNDMELEEYKREDLIRLKDYISELIGDDYAGY